MTSKFQIGKKYQHSVTYSIGECSYKDEYLAVLKCLSQSVCVFPNDEKFWKEPVVHKRWVHFYVPKSDDFDVRSFACLVSDWRPDPKWFTYLGCVPVEFKEEE